jgi:formylmethanofuran dehydrogenase subunit C
MTLTLRRAYTGSVLVETPFAAGMVAGSIFALDPVGRHSGAGMKRGTLTALAPAPELLPTCRYDCSYRPAFIELYLRRLAVLGFGPPPSARAPVDRYHGDLVALGLGEVLLSPSAS